MSDEAKYASTRLDGDEMDSLLTPAHPSIGKQSAASLGALQPQYATSRLRWLVLAAAATLNFSSAVNWVSFVAIADITEEYYVTSSFNVNMLSMVFMIASLATGLFWAWLLDTIGLSVGLWIGVFLNAIGAVVRLASTLHPTKDEHGFENGHFAMLIGGQVLCALANPIGLYSPAKVADIWFPQERRALANMICSMANPLGIAVGMVGPPNIALAMPTVAPGLALGAVFFKVTLTLTVISAMSLVLTLFIWKNRPVVPPSPSADDKRNVKLPFKEGLKQLARNRPFLLMAALWSISIGNFNVLITLMEQMLCPFGYTDKFVGICGAAMSGTGLLGAAAMSIYVDRTKNFVSTLKVCYALALMCMMGYLLTCIHPGFNTLVVAMLSLFGFFGYGLLPIMMELAVEVTYPVNTGLCSGILWMCGQMMGAILILGTQQPLFERDLNALQVKVNQCSNKHPKDLTYAGLFSASLATAMASLFILIFKAPYRRLYNERHGALKHADGTNIDLPRHY